MESLELEKIKKKLISKFQKYRNNKLRLKKIELDLESDSELQDLITQRTLLDNEIKVRTSKYNFQEIETKKLLKNELNNLKRVMILYYKISHKPVLKIGHFKLKIKAKPVFKVFNRKKALESLLKILPSDFTQDDIEPFIELNNNGCRMICMKDKETDYLDFIHDKSHQQENGFFVDINQFEVIINDDRISSKEIQQNGSNDSC